jgi:predicted nucleic acid-binding protein
LDRWLNQIKAGYENRILSVPQTTAELWGRMNAVRPYPVVNGLLAATAKEHDLMVVTRNIKDIKGAGIRCLNPFK